MPELSLTVPPLKKIIQFQERICFFSQQHKQQPLHQVSDGETSNLVWKRMLEIFLKVPLLKKLEFQNQKKTMKFVQKENFEQKAKPMIENLQDELYQ